MFNSCQSELLSRTDSCLFPDIMHSYLGLAALSLYGEEGIKSLDPALCISRNAAANLQHVAWRKQTDTDS